MSLLLSVAAAVSWSAPARAAEPRLQIRHEPVKCVLSERYPQLDACLEPPSTALQSARVYFKAEGADGFHYVDMKAVGPCYRATLPAPKSSTRHVRYYVTATAEDGRSAQSREQQVAVVSEERSCPGGVAAPFLSAATVSVGGGGLPQGFVGTGGLLSGTGRKAVAGIVGAGAVGAALALGGGGGGASTGTGGTGSGTPTEPPATTNPPATEPPATTTTTTTQPPAPTTTTTTAPPPTTTTTTQPSPCAVDTAAPTVNIKSPKQDAKVRADVTIDIEARDQGAVPTGIDVVRVTAEEQSPGQRKVDIAALRGSGPSFQTTWTLPSCARQNERWRIFAEAVDRCGHSATDSVRIQRDDAVCPRDVVAAADRPALEAASPAPAAAALTSDLALVDAAGQVTVNAADAAFPRSGVTELVLPVRRGRNRVEAVLVEAAGQAGTWRFAITAPVRPGSLRSLAGDVSALGADEIVYRLRGRPGERTVFEFDLE